MRRPYQRDVPAPRITHPQVLSRSGAQFSRRQNGGGSLGNYSPRATAQLNRLAVGHNEGPRMALQEYTGCSAGLKQRVKDHNAGKSTHTAKYPPRRLVWYCAFPKKMPALAFEAYLKSHSGRAFAMKRLLSGGTETRSGMRRLRSSGRCMRRIAQRDIYRHFPLQDRQPPVRPLLHDDRYVSLLVSRLDITVSVNDMIQRKLSIDDRP